MDTVFGSDQGAEEAAMLARIQRELFTAANLEIFEDSTGEKVASEKI